MHKTLFLSSDYKTATLYSVLVMLHVVSVNYLGNEVPFPCINADWYCTLLQLPEFEAGPPSSIVSLRPEKCRSVK
jgi:hypothetical protein